MEADLPKHRCRICSKSFSSGRSLGGHMRSHIQSSNLDVGKKEKLVSSRKKAGFRAGYGLRENPRKTCRLSDFVEQDFVSSSKECSECGKEFPSWKAFFDHMNRFHSELTCNRSLGAEVQEDESWTSKKFSLESFSDEEDDDDEDDEPSPLPLPSATRKRKLNLVSPIIEASSSSITDYESEQEDVAISLMMLSRDISGYWPTETTGAGEYSDKNSADFEEEYPVEDVSGKSKMKRKMSPGYQCTTCKKRFHSYHALGGHRASHKRIRTCCLLKTNEEDNMVHESLICGKAFASGHGLGGHRRSHLVSDGGNGRHEMAVISKLLDLNLPSQVDEEKSALSFNL